MTRTRTPWQRLVLSLVGIAVIGLAWHIAIQHLYTLTNEHALAAFTTITTNAFYVVAAIVIFMVTGRLVYEWKMQSVVQTIEQGNQELQEQRVIRPRDHDDPSLP